MSSYRVREVVRQWCQEVSAAEGVPFYDTVNRHQRPQDNIWFSVEFVAEGHEGNFCDRQYTETGFIALIVRARPGLGDQEAFSAIEAIVPALMLKDDLQVTLDSYDPPNEDTGGSADELYGIAVNLNYVFSRTV